MPALPGMGDFPDIPTARQFINQMMAQMAAASPPVDYTGVKKSDIQIPTSDGASIRAILYQPESKPAAGGPLVVLYHGGGFCLGTPEMEELFALELVKKHGAVAISVDYRMAPEHPFPGPITDSWDALKWAAKNASSVGADPSKGFIIGGTSAGAMITATISHMARDEKLSPPLTGVWLNVPMVIAQSVMPEKYRAIHTSYDQNKDAPVLDITAINFFMSEFPCPTRAVE
jgi:acetyl esterase/lipase